MATHKDYSEELSSTYGDRGYPVPDPRPGFNGDEHIGSLQLPLFSWDAIAVPSEVDVDAVRARPVAATFYPLGSRYDQHRFSGKGGPGTYDDNVDYIAKLQEHMRREQREDRFEWQLSSDGPTRHLMCAMLNYEVIGQGESSEEGMAKKYAAYMAVHNLGVL